MSPAPKGNQFWKLRSKHGRNRIFSEPKAMLEAAYEYFQWCLDNPLYEEQIHKIKVSREEEELQRVNASKPRVFTLEGLTMYMDVHNKYFNDFEASLDLSKEIDKDFSNVITHIRGVIYRQKFEGASSGFFNPTLIARDLGLKDSRELNIDLNRKSIGELFPEDDELITE